jgi:cytochrome c oxidase assembly protein subunit 15
MSSTAAESLARPGTQLAPINARHARALRLWLWALALLIVAMILVGGATRLTDSGLSITEWKPVTGAMPPLSDDAWQEAFDAYRQIPEYLEQKRGMSLDEFKTIYWWEWGHRFLGRLIGVAFLIPFLAFWFAGYIPRALLPRLVGLFVLGGLQGALGWYMVKSGLVARVDVSQYRLAAHLGLAVAILGYTLWLIFDLAPARGAVARTGTSAVAWVAGMVLGLIYLQILAGGLVAGLDAGFGYNTWPLINGAFIPSGLGEASPWYLNLFENPLTVQFDHRMLGYAVVLATILQWSWLALRHEAPELVTSGFILVCLALLQSTIGVWTLLLSVPIALGLAHQLGAVVLFAAALYQLWLSLERRAPRSQAAASA